MIETDPARIKWLILTPRQIEVLARLADPAEPTRGQVARDMGISPDTIRNHITFALRRLDVVSVAGAWARLGWLVAPTPDEARALGIDLRNPLE